MENEREKKQIAHTQRNKQSECAILVINKPLNLLLSKESTKKHTHILFSY